MDRSKLGSAPEVQHVVLSSEKMRVLSKELGYEGNSVDDTQLPKDSFSRKSLVASHEQGRIALEEQLKRKGKDYAARRICASCEGSAQAHSLPSPLSALKEIFLPQLELGRRHSGRALFGTFCVQPFRISSVNTVLADKSGKAVRVIIYNVASSLSSKDIEDRFHSGLKVAIKEPFFKLCSDGKVAVRVEDPADVAIVDDSRQEVVVWNDKLQQSRESNIIELEDLEQELDRIRAHGNRLFAEQDWHGAVEQYSACIARSSSVVGRVTDRIKYRLLLAFSNRAETWLQLHNFKDALDDANKALEFDPDHLKSISRRDRAWQGFGKVQAAPPAGKVRVATEEPTSAELPARGEKASKVKPTDSNNNPPPNVAKVKATELKSAHTGDASKIDSDLPPIVAKVKGTDLKAAHTGDASKVDSEKAVDLENSSGAASKLQATRSKPLSDSKSSSLPGEASSKLKSTDSTGKLTETRDIVHPSTPSKGKKNVIDAKSSASKRKKLANSKTNVPSPYAADVQLSEAKRDPSSPDDDLGVKLSHPQDIVPASAAPLSIEGENPTDSKGVTSMPFSSKGNATDSDKLNDSWKSSLPTDDPPLRSHEVKLATDDPPRRSHEVKQEAVKPYEVKQEQEWQEWPPIDCEGPLFASWLDSVRSAGDTHLSHGKWKLAIKSYDRVTEFSPPKRNRDKVMQSMLLAYSHRSEAWIWLGNYENALRDANLALGLDVGKHLKAAIGFEMKQLSNEVRRGRAFHGLGDYEQACSVFSAALAKCPDDKSITDFLEKSIICCTQSRQGLYDLDEYFLNGCRGPPPPCSDFVGPVEIRRVLGKGRGLFLTRDVEAGDLLLVSNPLAVVRRRYRRQDGEDEDYSRLAFRWRRNDTEVGLDDFVTRLSLLQSPRKMYQLSTLAVGEPDEETEIPDLNAFIPGSQFVLPASWENLSTDLERIRGIVLLNAVDGGLNPLDGAQNHDLEDGEEIGCVGLWALPSFMNHSCVPNSHMIDVGNAMFVRASRRISAGEELTRAYFNVYQNGLDRQDSCQEWLFVCNCERCVLEKTLASQRILPVHEYRSILNRVREESLKRLHSVEKDRSLSLLLPNPQPALLQLRKFADWFDGLLLQAEGLGNKEKAWIGASHLDAYISRFHTSKNRNQWILALENILEFTTNTAIIGIDNAENALQRAALLLAQVEDMYGKGSQTYQRIETRVLDLYGAAYGKLRKDILLSISRFMATVV